VDEEGWSEVCGRSGKGERRMVEGDSLCTARSGSKVQIGSVLGVNRGGMVVVEVNIGSRPGLLRDKGSFLAERDMKEWNLRHQSYTGDYRDWGTTLSPRMVQRKEQEERRNILDAWVDVQVEDSKAQ